MTSFLGFFSDDAPQKRFALLLQRPHFKLCQIKTQDFGNDFGLFPSILFFVFVFYISYIQNPSIFFFSPALRVNVLQKTTGG